MTDEIAIGGNVRLLTIGPDGLNRQVTTNTTCIGGHEFVANQLSGGSAQVDVLALGNDGSSGTSVSDRELNNPLRDVGLTSFSTTGATVVMRAFIPQLLSIGSSSDPVDELGIRLTTGDLLNHATIAPVDLSGTSTTLVAEVEITTQDA